MSKLMEDSYLYKLRLKDGVIDTLEALRARGVKMCVATATDKCLVEPALQRCGALGYFERVFSCVQEETSKNSPDIFIRAASFLGTDICDTLVVEDAPHAIETARNAGFPVAGVYDKSFDNQQDEIKAMCDFYFMSLDEMVTGQGASGK
jgi:HAD superfamily hydrolase (TIGR01509 family)